MVGCRALSTEYSPFPTEFRALLTGYMALLTGYMALFVTCTGLVDKGEDIQVVTVS